MKLINNREIVEKLEKDDSKNIVVDTTVKTLKFVIFEVDDKTYSLPGEIVQEIVLDLPIYYLPFVPPYIRGLINRHGQPYTVVDIKTLFEKKELSARRFIIIRNREDKISLLISEISKIINIEESSVSKITSENNTSDYFLNSIAVNGEDIPVLNIEQILRKINSDIS